VDECKPLPARMVTGTMVERYPSARGLYSFRFQLKLSSSVHVHRVTQRNPQCVLELLKLSSNVNGCEPPPSARP